MSRSLKRSLKRAFLGFKVGFQETNFRRHLVSTISALICAFYYHLSMFELMIIILCIFLVLSAELMNTAIERLAYGHKSPRDALDVSASAVLLIAVGSFIVGLIILLPHAWESPWVLMGVIIITPILWVFMEKNGSSK
jgi:undecaprenol kinase